MKRYNFDVRDLELDSEGRWVEYEDALRETEDLKQKLRELTSVCNNVASRIREESCYSFWQGMASRLEHAVKRANGVKLPDFKTED